MSEIRPIFDKEAEAQIELINKHLIEIGGTIKKLSSSKLKISSFGEAKKEITETENEVTKLTAAQKALEAANKKLIAASTEEGRQLIKIKTETAALNAETRKQHKETLEAVEATKLATGSNDELKHQLKTLTKEYNALSAAERDNTTKGQELKEKLHSITETLKSNEKAIGDNRRNVGNYQASIESALDKVNLYGVNIGELTKNIRAGAEQGKGLVKATLEQASAAQVSATATTAQASATTGATVASGGFSKALQFLKIALISTGIGAIVVALGLLVAGFASTQRGADALTRTFIPMKAVIASLWGVVQKLSTGLVDAFKQPQKLIKDFGNLILTNLQNRFIGLFDIIKNIATLNFGGVAESTIQVITGVDNLSGKIKENAKQTKEFLSDAIKKGKEIADLSIKIEKSQNNLNYLKDEYEDKERELLMISKDTSLSFEKRAKAANEIIRITENYSKEEAKVKQMQIDQLKLQQSLNDTKRTGESSTQELIKLEMELDDINDQAAEKRLEQTKVLSGLKKEQQQIAKEAADKERERLAQIAEINRTNEEQIKFEYEEKLKLLKLNRDDAKLTAAELMAKKKLTEEYIKSIKGSEEIKTIVERAKALQSEQTELEENIKLLNQYYIAASPELQAEINNELLTQTTRLQGVKNELKDIGAILVEYETYDDLISQTIKKQEDAYFELRSVIEKTYDGNRTEQYYKEVETARKKYEDDLINSTIFVLENILKDEKLKLEEKQKYQKAYYEEIDKLRKKDVENETVATKTKAEITKEALDQTAYYTNAAMQAVSLVSNEMYARQAENLQNELELFKVAGEKKLSNDLTYATMSGANAQELEVIKQRAAEATAKKEREIKIKQAKANKEKALLDIGIQTLVAIMNAVAQSPMTGGLPGSAIAAGLGAINLALVASKPIPQFYKGVENYEGGMARIGERGAELIEEPSRTWIATKDMTTYLPKGTNVKTAQETKKILQDPNTMILKGILNKKDKPIININVSNNSYIKYATR